MAIRVLHVLAGAGEEPLQREVQLLVTRLQGREVTAGLLKDSGAFARLIRDIRRFAPDIVHTHSARCREQVAALLAGVKWRVHTERRARKPRPTPLEVAVSRLHLALPHRIVALLPEHARELADKYRVERSKIAVIPKGLASTSGVTAAERALGRSRLAVPQGHVVLLVAPCADVPASQLLSLHALAAVPRELREQTVMVVLAPPAYDPLLREAAAQLDVRENVRFVGDDAEFQQLLPAADVLIVTPFSEDMPLAPIQAMFARIAIVSTPWAGAETMLGNGLYGFITGGFEPSDVASEVIRALRNDGARNAMIHRAHERARAEYDIDRVADAHRSLYRQMCAAITCAR